MNKFKTLFLCASIMITTSIHPITFTYHGKMPSPVNPSYFLDVWLIYNSNNTYTIKTDPDLITLKTYYSSDLKNKKDVSSCPTSYNSNDPWTFAQPIYHDVDNTVTCTLYYFNTTSTTTLADSLFKNPTARTETTPTTPSIKTATPPRKR